MSNVLIVEDEEPLLEILADVTRDLGHTVITAQDGDEALRLARKKAPDLIVSDYMMPRRSGVELLHALRAEAALAEIPFVMMSAARPVERAEATRFLAKPLILADYEKTIIE